MILLCRDGYGEDNYAKCLCASCKVLLKNQLTEAAQRDAEHVATIRKLTERLKQYERGDKDAED